jgi:beta-lactamase regulating signal transducer with metallopeptidase domain
LSSLLSYVLHLFLSTTIVFIVLALLIEVIFCIFLKSSRTRSILRFLLLAKLPFDFIVYQLFEKNVFVNFNPFSCEKYVESFLLSLLPSYWKEGLKTDMSISDLILQSLPAVWVEISLFTILGISIACVLIRIISFFRSSYFLSKLCSQAWPCDRPVQNPSLRQKLDSSNTVILLSPKVSTPMAVKNRFILFPSQFVTQLSQEEFEAVVAHEWEHLRWRDPLIRMLMYSISSFFWWIPMKRWLQICEKDQEYACDAAAQQYGFSPSSLATAIVKATKNAKRAKTLSTALCYFASAKTPSFKRLRWILEHKAELLKQKKAVSAIGLSLAVFSFFIFWIC